MISTHKRHPCRPVCIYNRKVKHIHHFSVKPGRISTTFGHETGNLRMSAFIENNSIEHAIYDVPQSTGQNKSHTDDITCFEPFLYDFIEIPPYQCQYM